MKSHPALKNFLWNESATEPFDVRNNGLVNIIAFDDAWLPEPVGSGFLIQANGSTALGVTAAHNFDCIDRAQDKPSYNRFIIPDVLRNTTPLNIDGNRLRALCLQSGRHEMCEFNWVIWESKTDLAYFEIKLPEKHTVEKKFLQSHVLVDSTIPEIGEVVVMLGYPESKGTFDIRPNVESGIKIEQRLMARIGRVTAHHMEGYYRPTPCIETSIPVFSGMSGGLVARIREDQQLGAIGVISSDPDAPLEEKQNRSIAGKSIAVLLNAEIQNIGNGQQNVTLKYNNAQSAGDCKYDNIK